MRAQELVGRTITGTYVGVRVVGSGNMGTVLEVRHVRLPKRFAMKVLHPELGEGAEIFARFRREAEIASSLGHPHIVNVIDWNKLPDGAPFLVMEFLEGEDLHARMERQGPLPLGFVLELARQVGSALSAAHKHGVVHRDLKPQNIFLCREDRGEEVVEIAKVLDFGISKILGGEGTYTGAMRVMGTPLYMAPEQAMGLAQTVDGRADQFALGAILYHALSGRRPFDGASVVEIALKVMSEDPPPLSQIVPGLPPPVSEAIMQALAKDRENRFPSIGDFLRALGAQVGPAGLLGLTGQGPRLSMSGPVQVTPMAVSGGLPRPDASGGMLLPSAATPRRGALSPSGSLTTETDAPSLSAPLLPRRAQGLLALLLIAGLSGAASFGLVRLLHGPRRPPLAPPPPRIEAPPAPVVRPPEVPKVKLRFVVQPARAEIYLDGHRVDSQIEVPKSEIGMRLEVKASGYLPQTDTVVPSGDQRILIRLAPKRRGPATPPPVPAF